MRTRALLLAALLPALVVLSGSSSALSATSHTPRFDSFKLKVGCGVQLKSLGGMSCFSGALPATELDGYIELRAHGDPKLGERGDSPWRGGKATTLRPGDRWSRAGVECERTRKLLRCTNADANGFTLTPKGYTVF
jgi:hypothetical protein